MLNKLISIFENANTNLIKYDLSLFEIKVSERTLCGALMIWLREELKHSEFSHYYVDVEYNRNKGAKIKTYKKTYRGAGEKIIPINCDLIIHSRGENPEFDNLIAIEMKKNSRLFKEKENDRDRLIALTKDSFDDVWAWEGTLPEHVCRYGLGVYYEINYRARKISLEYYAKGERLGSKYLNF